MGRLVFLSPVAWLAALILGSVPAAQGGWNWLEEQKLTPPAPSNSGFGSAVAIWGDLVLAGAIGDDHAGNNAGAAFVYERTGTSWSQQARLTASDARDDGQLGWAVALGSDIALASTVSSGIDEAVYVFHRTGSSWAEETKLTVGTHDRFGWSLSLSGDTAVVGAPTSFVAGYIAGTAHVFVRSGTTWSHQATLVGDDAVDDAWFGESVAIDGDTVAVTQTGYNGSVYVFLRSGTTWTRQTKFSCPVQPAWFWGKDLAVSGDTLLVGAPHDDPGGVLSAGSARVWVRSGTAWSEQQILTADVPVSGAYFGDSVALEGDLAVIGAPIPSLAGTNDRAFVFARAGTTWQLEAVLGSNDLGYGDFGAAVGLSGHTACVGALEKAYVMVRTATAGATFRNAGTNPSSHDVVAPPILGGTYTGTVDLAGTTGHGFAWLVGYTYPLTLTLGGGQTLLVDFTSPSGELLQQAPLPGPLATFQLPIPADAAWAGFECSTQALHFTGVQPFALSNAQDLFLGY